MASFSSLLAALANKTEELRRDKYVMTPQYSSSSRTSQPYQDNSRDAHQTNLQLMADANARMDAIRNESAVYSEGKLREQQGRGIAPTGNAYGDARLRDQLGLQPAGVTPSKPLENFLGSVSDQESYRPAMMQFVASGGQKPKWYTGNFEVDKPNIEAAINATMTPQQQLIRQEAKQRSDDMREARLARNELEKQRLADKERSDAAKREGMQRKPEKVLREDKLSAHAVLGGILGADYSKVPMETLNAIALRVASRAKSIMGTEEAKGSDIEELMQEEVNEMIQNGELKLPEHGTGISGFFGFGNKPAEFNPKGTAPAQQQTATTATSKPVSLKTLSDYNSLPSGALYIHPSDGKTYRKK